MTKSVWTRFAKAVVMSSSHVSGHDSLLGCQSSNSVLGRPGLQRMPPSRSFHLGTKASVKDVCGGVKIIAYKQHQQDLVDRIREQLLNTEPSPPSPYDTAWVAMVPAWGSLCAPRFPRCIDWIMENQHADGSWGLKLELGNPLLGKDALSSTLACVLALRTWGIGDEHVRRGLRFIGHNSYCLRDGKCDTPVGFNIIFPGMLAQGLGMGLEIPLTQPDIDTILQLRNTELKSKAFMAYVAEGLGDFLDWNQAMVYQRKNGSFFNSPATTAAAAIHSGHNNLDSLVTKFGSSVPTVYPQNAYTRLRMVDTLENMGISPSFLFEINSILDMTYRSWLDNDEEIMLDMATCAMAFRLLHMHGYGVSSVGLAQFSKESSFHDSIQGHLNDTEALLELHRASQVQMLEKELILESIGSWSAKLLRQSLCSGMQPRSSVNPAEVEYALKFPFYSTLERLEHKRNIEHFRTERFQILKSAYCLPHRADGEIVALAADGFRSFQAIYQEELQLLKSWVKEVRLDELEFPRVMPLHVLFSAAATMFPSKLSEARMAWSKNSILTTVVDDLFDLAGSREEMQNLVALVDRWDAHQEVGFCSQRVEILFRAIYNTNNEIGAKAAAVQNRSGINHIAELLSGPIQLLCWVDAVRGMLVEAEWRMSGRVPSSMEEYMVVAEPSFALGPIVPTSLYLVGPELPEDVVRVPEYGEMLRHMNICGRLLNDLRTYGKESGEGNVNSVLLLAELCYGGRCSALSIEAAKRELSRTIEASRRELLRLVVRDGGAVPRPCRQLFWNMCKVLHLFYLEKDGYFSPKEMLHAANAVLLQTLQVPAPFGAADE